MSRTLDHDTSFDAIALEESVHSVVKIHSCECGYSTSDKSNFNKHKKRCSQTNQPLPTAQAGPSTSTPLKAPPQAVAMNRPTHVCDQCGKHLRSKFGMQLHINYMQLHIKNKHSKDFKYECTLCDKKFNKQRPYRYHCAKHLNVSIDKCHHCKKDFNSPGSLSRHLVVCTGTAQTKKFKCDLCAASFPHKYRLTYHKKGKHGPKRYNCDACGKMYAWRSSLKEHKAVCNN